jgi:hypothetical protein
MTPTTGRQIDPAFTGGFFDFSDVNLADILVDDGRTPPPQPLTQNGTGAPPNPGGAISRPVNPSDDLLPHFDFNPGGLAVPNGDIGLWSGEEGADNPFWTAPSLLPAEDQRDLSSLPNGGPGGVAALKEFTREDWIRAEAEREKAKQEYDNTHKLKKWEDMHRDTGGAGGGRSWIDDAIDYLFGDWSFFYVDPEHSTAAVPEPGALVASLLGSGSTALPDGLGLDKDLIGRMLGGYGTGDSSNVGKLADFLKALDAFDNANPAAAGALFNDLGFDDFAGMLREFLPHFDVDAATLEAVMKEAGYEYREPIDFSRLLIASEHRSEIEL